MAEKVGEIFYECTVDTSGLVTGQRAAEKSVDKLEASLTEVAQATKIHVTATQAAATAMRVAAKAAADNAVAAAKLAASENVAASATEKHVMSAKALAAATRGIPAQFTDIATSLAAGQNPMSVLMQQGGQLKDMFGGIAPAAKALGTYVLGLVNPFTVAAAAIGTFVYGFVKGSQEMTDFKSTLALTGNASGVTADQLNTLADKFDSISGVTRGQAAEALNVFAQAGIRGQGSLAKFTEAAIRLEQVGGPSIEKTAQMFKDLESDPVKALLKLNETFNFLTDSTYKQVKALDDHGLKVQAAKVAQDAFADAILNRTPKIVEDLGTIQKMWRSIWGAIKDAGDAALSFGRTTPMVQQLAEAQEKLNALQTQGTGISARGGRRKASQEAIDAQQKIVDGLAIQIRYGEAVADLSAKDAARKKAAASFDQAGEKFLDKELKMKREIAAAEAEGLEGGKSAKEIADRIAAIKKSYAEKGPSQLGRADAAQAYYQGLLAENQNALEKIDTQEQRALSENASRRARDVQNAEVYEKAKVAINEKYARQRALLEEHTTQDVADLNIALTTDQVAKIEAIRQEGIRRANAAHDLKTEATPGESERAIALANFNARRQLAALEEQLVQTTAENNINATVDELTKIDLARQENARRAKALADAGVITAKQAAADTAKAAIDAQNAIRDKVMSVNPLAQLTKEYQDKLAIVQFYEQQMAQAGVDGSTFVEQKKTELARQYQQQRLALAEAEFVSQGEAQAFLMNSLNSLQSTAASAITGLISGTMSASDAMRNLAGVVLNEAVGSLVQIGVQYIKNALIGQAADKALLATKAANAALYTAAVSAQVAVNSSLAASAAFASTAAIPIVGLGLAPAAAATAAAATAGLGAAAIAAAPIAGARQYGGPASAGNLYKINETGQPEMFTAANGSQYMLPNKSGKVTPADDVGGGKGWTVHIHNNTPGASGSVRDIDMQARTISIAVDRAVNTVAEHFATNSRQDLVRVARLVKRSREAVNGRGGQYMEPGAGRLPALRREQDDAMGSRLQSDWFEG